MNKLFINIHGFLSSAQSEKVVAFGRSLEPFSEIQLLTPCLPDNPAAALDCLRQLIENALQQSQHVALVGHSLGGYYATFLANEYDLNAVLVNPVVRGYDILCEFFGECYNPHTDTHFNIGEKDIEYLFSLYLEPLPKPEQFLVLQALDDEILNPQDVINYYEGCRFIIEPQGKHDFTHFSDFTDDIVGFAFGVQ